MEIENDRAKTVLYNLSMLNQIGLVTLEWANSSAPQLTAGAAMKKIMDILTKER